MTHPLEADWARWRARWYGGERINLNPGTLGTPPRAVGEAMRAFEERCHGWPLGTYEAGRVSLVEARRRLAALYPLPRAVLGHGATAQMGGWMSALARRFGTVRLLTTTEEHEGAVYGLAHHSAYRVETVSPERLLEVAGERRHDVVLCSEVTWTDGRRLPLADVRAVAGDAWLVADAAQVVGLDQPFADADLILASLHKWVGGPPGTGVTWLSERAAGELGDPTAAGHPVDPAAPLSRFEPSGAQDFARWAGLVAALDVLAEVGVDRARARTRALGQRLAAGLEGVLDGWEARFMGADGWQRGPAVAPGHVVVVRLERDPYPLYRGLEALGVHVKCIKGEGRSQLRMGVPWHETEARVDLVVERVAQVAGGLA